MSFALEVKQEVALNELKSCCINAQLSALVQLTSTIVIRNSGMALCFKTENPTTAKRILKLMKIQFDVKSELSMIHKMNLKKNNIYQIYIYGDIMTILKTLGLSSSKGLLDCPLAKVVHKDCCARAYLAGAFMASGSINNPIKSNYHLEIVVEHENHAQFIEKLMNRYDLHAKTILRKNHFVIYVKIAEKIGDFIRLIGAVECLFKFEDIRIQRDFKNNLLRLDNCELANEMKVQKAASDQMAIIQQIFDLGLFDQCDAKLKEIINVRIKYPDASLNELCSCYESLYNQTISKSGLKHRFNKLSALVSANIDEMEN